MMMVLKTLSLLFASLVGLLAQELPAPESCVGKSCYPDIGNLLVGRSHLLEASSTCGLEGPERFCVVSNVRNPTKCTYCDSRSASTGNLNHRVNNIATTYSQKRLNNWWQAINGEENVFIQLNLEAEFQFTHLIIVFKTFRPKAMILERSYDFGETWNIYRYFAYDCAKVFPGVPTGPVTGLNETICEEKYSSIEESEFGEVIFKALPPSLDPPILNPYAPEVQNLLKLTNLRLNFTMLHTLGDELLTEKPGINEKYYYSIYDMVVRGRCSCYGHAAECRPEVDDLEPHNPNKLYSRCVCQHNTKGQNCELCEDFYWDQPWKAANGSEPNACKKCNCNNHADGCHFDAAVYELNEKRSGGVCDGCKHNTQGNQCEECQQFYYARDDRDITDVDVCLPCDCDVYGTLDGGICDGKTDPLIGTVAGRCKCKQFVTGLRCETCQNGYWKLRDDNPDGCQKCTCNLLGTTNNQGCDKISGLCPCKRFVTGNDCDQCEPGYWGLGESPDGCAACDCDAGGSLNGTRVCDPLTGQCPCREGITGRRCDKAETRRFVGDIAFLIYEAEHAKGSPNTEIVIKIPTAGVARDWTGPGFMKAFEGDDISFTVGNIPLSTNYRIAIRYKTDFDWDIVKVIVDRPTFTDPNGVCGNNIFVNNEQSTRLSADERYVIMDSQSVCLESGVTYKVKLELTRFNSNPGDPNGMILIDSIVLIPEIQSIPIQNPHELLDIEIEFEKNKCLDFALNLRTKAIVPEECKKLSFSIGAAVHNKSYLCNCDSTGSSSSNCDQNGGQCFCKENVEGRRCDRCRPGSYGFGVSGCSDCNCHGTGAVDGFCDITTGSCSCYANIGGRRCDKCIDGFYNFPNCRVCNCNGYADTCEDFSGFCLDCRDNTTGQSCETCKKGYYGDPRLGSNIACKPCTCPGGPAGPQHAEECVLDHRTRSQRCYCPFGYKGAQCERCDINYYGDPLAVNGSCMPCHCNGNIDMAVPDSCDSVTGMCTKCRHNTEGDHCELCSSGYYGNATSGGAGCDDCGCDFLGTNLTAANICDRSTGQCVCHPNVIGTQCDRCAADHWKLASGEGCEVCDCDLTGSVNSTCDETTGMCQCIEGRGGRRCDQCEDNYFGNPATNSCQPCNCDMGGSADLQCNREYGNCTCVEGVTGDKCDRCDRGTTGILPNCVPCGDCFDNWDNILDQLRVQSNILIDRANLTKTTGAVKAYDAEFKAIEDALAYINRSLSQASSTAEQIENLQSVLWTLESALNQTTDNIRSLHEDAIEKADDVSSLRTELNDKLSTASDLLADAQRIMKQAQTSLNNDLQGAFSTVKASRDKSNMEVQKAREAEQVLAESMELRNETEAFLERQKENFTNTFDSNKEKVTNLSAQVDSMVNNINSINKIVCDRKLNDMLGFCDLTCGGGGCDQGCGEGSSCTNGVVGKVRDGKMHVDAAEKSLKEQEDNIASLLPQIDSTLANSSMAIDTANETLLYLQGINRNVSDHLSMVNDVLEKVDTFFNRNHTKPEEIMELVARVMAIEIQLSPSEIESLGQQITAIIANLTNIDTILNATASDKKTAEDLKNQALNVSKRAREVLGRVQGVNQRIQTASDSQRESEQSIEAMQANIQMASEFIQEVEAIVGNLSESTDAIGKDLESLLMRAKNVSLQFLQDGNKITSAEEEARRAQDLAQRAKEAADDLEQQYNGRSIEVDDKYKQFETASHLADRIMERAKSLESKINNRYGKITRLKNGFLDNEEQLMSLKDQILKLQQRMDESIAILQDWTDFQRTCF